MACDLILYLLLLKEKEDDFEPIARSPPSTTLKVGKAHPTRSIVSARPSLSFRRGTEGEVAGRQRSSGVFYTCGNLAFHATSQRNPSGSAKYPA